jgi:hypothetical protein
MAAPSYQFSIRGLMSVMVLIAAGLAGLHYPTPLWANFWFSLPLAAVTLAILAAVYGRGQERAFWWGFAVCGGVYFVLALGPWVGDEVGSKLITTPLLDLAAPYLAEKGSLVKAYIVGINPTYGPPSPWQLWNFPDLANGYVWRAGYVSLHGPALYFRIGHGVCCLIVGFLGGEAVRRMAAMNERPGAGTSES